MAGGICLSFLYAAKVFPFFWNSYKMCAIIRQKFSEEESKRVLL